ncbi:ATP-grasp ribosomal peptide maturase [Streptomyces sp. CA-111067]|uniref:ATP-grasp ribosomal peptide maturase n=1 Tax=Streptomyces sp. CA-111067 TaxID=3240046 RepID=UPI003D951503
MKPSVLVVTSIEDNTADWVIDALNRRRVPVVRIDPADLGPALHLTATVGGRQRVWGGRLRTASRELDLGRVAAVYHRRPSPWRFHHLPAQAAAFAANEARHGLGALLANLPRARYVNHPGAVNQAEFKTVGLQAAVDLGFTVPATMVTNDVEAARAFAAEHGPVIYKPFRGLPPGPDGHTGAIWAQRVDPGTFDESIEVTSHMFQAEVRHKTGDARVTMVGEQVFAHRITSPDGALDWRRGDWAALEHEPIAVPDPVRRRMRAYLDHFSLVFGCFDVAMTGTGRREEHWTWIECNANGQWGWLPDAEQITEAFADALTEGWT